MSTRHRVQNEFTRLHHRAQKYLNQGRFAEARGICHRMIACKPGDAEGYFLLGIAEDAANNMGAALEAIQKAIAIRPSAEYHAHFARLLTRLKRTKDALDAADRASAMSPPDALTLDTIGCVYSRTGQHDKAIPLFEKAVRSNPERPRFRFNLATSLQFNGDFDAAENHYERIIAEFPGFVKAHTALSNLKKQTPDKNHIDHLIKLLETNKEKNDSLHIHYALAKEYEDIEDHDAAFRHLQNANGMRKAQLGYSIDFDKTIFTGIKEYFTDRSDTKGKRGHHSKAPIFIVGMPRTGTTLADRIVSSHPDVDSAGELQTFPLLVKRMSGTRSRYVLDTETIKKSMSIDRVRLGTQYVEQSQTQRGNSPHFVDKMPLNFFNIGLIAEALPDAKIICLRRNPMDTCWSNLKHFFATDFSYYNYSYDLMDTAIYYTLFDGLMSFWDKHFPGRVFELHYEQVVDDMETQARRLIDYLGLPWADACLDFHENRSAVATPSAVQVRQPIYRTSVGKWRRYEEHLKPVRDFFFKRNVSSG